MFTYDELTGFRKVSTLPVSQKYNPPNGHKSPLQPCFSCRLESVTVHERPVDELTS